MKRDAIPETSQRGAIGKEEELDLLEEEEEEEDGEMLFFLVFRERESLNFHGFY